MIKEEDFKELPMDERVLAISDFMSSAKEYPDINHYIIDGQHRSGNNFWNILFRHNLKVPEHKLFGQSFHNPELYKIDNKHNHLDNVFNVIPFRDPWEAAKSFLVLVNKEDSASYEDIYSYLNTCEAFYDTIILEKRNIIPIEVGFGSVNSKRIVCHILSLDKNDTYTSFEDININQENSLRHNHTPLNNKDKLDLIKKAEDKMNSPRIIRHVSEVSKKYYIAKLIARRYWEDRGI
jgi:hypothetical protein